ncbi:MAG: ABC transporter permease [Flavobacteriaceae bacterium]|nr:ABC transporter permease [Flavobacteriaceae bacterium]
MRKILAATYKEFLLLSRDIGGIAILFVMPLVLILTVTLIQDSSFKTISEEKIPVLFVDNDGGAVANKIQEDLSKNSALELVIEQSEGTAKTSVRKGNYQLAIVVPKGISTSLKTTVDHNVEGILSSFSYEEEEKVEEAFETVPTEAIKLYFDPATQSSFKSAVKSGIASIILGVETQTIYQSFQEQMEEDSLQFQTSNLIRFQEEVPQKKGAKLVIPNAVQHNVPAWSLFAIFFIIVPLSINLVKEKNQGTFVRMQTVPTSYATVLAGKIINYTIVCILQFLLMLLVGMYVFPYFGLEALQLSNNLHWLLVVAAFCGLAAIGLGILLGTIANTQEQSAPFGATLVVILAAIGGVWVPVFVMPNFMQMVAKASPMNWGLNAFYDLFLRQGSFGDIWQELLLLLLFFCFTTFIALIYNQKKNAV